MNSEIEKLKRQRDMLLEALKKSDVELSMFADDAVCDHSVGICYCGFHRARELNRVSIAAVEGEE